MYYDISVFLYSLTIIALNLLKYKHMANKTKVMVNQRIKWIDFSLTRANRKQTDGRLRYFVVSVFST